MSPPGRELAHTRSKRIPAGKSALKRLRGNPGHRPLNDKEPTPEVREPEMPPGLPPLAQKEWADIVPKLLGLGVLSELDSKALAAYCFQYARWHEAEELVMKTGGRIVTDKVYEADGNIVSEKMKRNPADIVSSDAMKLMKSYLSEFGLTPATRAKLRIEGAKEVDPVDEYLSRKNRGTVVN